MTALARELAAVLCPGMRIPPEFPRLYDWISGNGSTSVYNGQTSGWLDVTDDAATATNFEFRADGTDMLEHWIGTDDPKVIQRLCVFGKTGDEGSMAAFWLDDSGEQQIVHMGSGSGSTTVCLLGRTPLEFLRLLAVGYEELCWSEHWDEPPADEDGNLLDTDTAYRRWLVAEFGVTIPATATALATPAEMEDTDPVDPFARWVAAVNG